MRQSSVDCWEYQSVSLQVSNGQFERLNQQLETSLRMLSSSDSSSWSRNVIWAEFAHNSLPF